MIDDGKAEYHIDEVYLNTLMGLTGWKATKVLGALYEIAQPVIDKVRSPNHHTHWSQKSFFINGVPFPLTVKAKFVAWARNTKTGTIICTFSMKKGKILTWTQEKILNEILESTILNGDNNDNQT